MKSEVLRILSETDDYVSGQDICHNLGVSRTAVWKVINQLKEEGYLIEAVPNRGYKIVERPDIITDREIKSQLSNKGIISEVVYFDETDSTNNQAKISAESGAGHGTLFITECQTGGRGRRGRSWVSPVGSGIWMSLLLRPDMKPERAPQLTIVAAMAMTEAISEAAKCEAYIKWPNDIVINGKKICGILTEMSAEVDCVNYVVIGIGINANTAEFDDSIKDIASSIFIETGKPVRRSSIVSAFSDAFAYYYKLFLKEQCVGPMVEAYNKVMINRGRQVRIEAGEESYIATAVGIDDNGELIVEKENGEVCKVMTGEVSVRGLYGYV